MTTFLSQRISEGDGISLVVEVGSHADIAAADAAGADGVVVTGGLSGLDEVELPVLWRGDPGAGADAGADALVVAADEEDELAERVDEARHLGLEPVVAVASEDELELALEHVDPEIVLLRGEEGAGSLEHVLELLESVPAGKLAIAWVALESQEDLAALERTGVDAVLLPPGVDVAALTGGEPPSV